MKLVVTFGTRPEGVKLAPVVDVLRRRGAHVVTVATSQHRELLAQALRVFRIVPDRDLDVMRPKQRLADLSARILPAMADLLEEERPDAVLVQGDTTSTFVCALAAFYANIPVAHVEAGLRSYDAANPFPEEINRRLAGTLARWHFAPTETARGNLLREGVAPDRIHVTGNTVVDALELIVRSPEFAESPAPVPRALGRRTILVTLHRRESWGTRLEAMCRVLGEVAGRHPDLDVVFPVHLNPTVRASIDASLAGRDRVHLIEPLDYTTFLKQLQASWLVVTDSGGVQEEAPSFGVPTLVLREVTERVEALDAGVARLVGTSPHAIVAAIEELLRDPSTYHRMTGPARPFGDGRAAERIADVLLTPSLG
ncbi:MAG: non-hydrolyzing UDP-N-acetylglucosamine 2-epimerase [Acidobacteriota bacterium]